MLRLSKLADYGVVVLSQLASGQLVQNSAGVAAATGIPEPTVAKVMKALASAGLVTSQRGAKGGYLLARPLSRIAVSDVVQAIDGPIFLTSCVEGSTSECEARQQCAMHRRWDAVNNAIRATLAAISLSDLTGFPEGGQPQSAPSLPAAE